MDVAIKNKINLKIAGTGPLENKIVDYAAQNKNIEFLGHQSGDVLTQLIKASYFVIVPSEWYENNPMTIIEAFALGKPVIGANIGGIPEIVIHNKTGFLFKSRDGDDLANAIMKTKQLSTEAYAAMCANARKFAEINFSAEAHYEKLIEVYTQVIKNA